MKDIENLLREQLPFWNQLEQQDKELLANRSKRIMYQPKEHIGGSIQDCLGVLLLQRGELRVYLSSDDGKEVTIYHLQPFDVCMLSASCMFDQISFDVHIDAIEESEAILIPIDVFTNLMSQNIYIENYSYKMVSERFSDVIQAVERMLFYSLDKRIAAFLIDFSFQQHEDTIIITHEQISRYIGSAREAVSRILKQMEHDHEIKLFRGGIKILNKKSLYDKFEH